MIVDSSALTEQVVDDAIESGFGSSGQRCSALRIMAIQEEVYENTIKMLEGALQKIEIGDPRKLKTDIGPVIDEDSKNNIENHIQENNMNLLSRSKNEISLEGNFTKPTLLKIEN